VLCCRFVRVKGFDLSSEYAAPVIVRVEDPNGFTPLNIA
jgi:hypothetical protein